MELFDAIGNRRSIRRFTDREVPEEAVRRIIQAGIDAPSAKNRQPWRFVVLTGKSKAAMLNVMDKKIAEMEAAAPEEKAGLSWVRNSMRIMSEAPVAILILNPEGKCMELPRTEPELFRDLTDIQSVGAAIQNMTLAATGLGLGSLWICDVLFACREICGWLGSGEQLAAALSVGYAGESPGRRPRKEMESVTEWRS